MSTVNIHSQQPTPIQSDIPATQTSAKEGITPKAVGIVVARVVGAIVTIFISEAIIAYVKHCNAKPLEPDHQVARLQAEAADQPAGTPLPDAEPLVSVTNKNIADAIASGGEPTMQAAISEAFQELHTTFGVNIFPNTRNLQMTDDMPFAITSLRNAIFSAIQDLPTEVSALDIKNLVLEKGKDVFRTACFESAVETYCKDKALDTITLVQAKSIAMAQLSGTLATCSSAKDVIALFTQASECKGKIKLQNTLEVAKNHAREKLYDKIAESTGLPREIVVASFRINAYKTSSVYLAAELLESPPKEGEPSISERFLAFNQRYINGQTELYTSIDDLDLPDEALRAAWKLTSLVECDSKNGYYFRRAYAIANALDTESLKTALNEFNGGTLSKDSLYTMLYTISLQLNLAIHREFGGSIADPHINVLINTLAANVLWGKVPEIGALFANEDLIGELNETNIENMERFTSTASTLKLAGDESRGLTPEQELLYAQAAEGASVTKVLQYMIKPHTHISATTLNQEIAASLLTGDLRSIPPNYQVGLYNFIQEMRGIYPSLRGDFSTIMKELYVERRPNYFEDIAQKPDLVSVAEVVTAMRSTFLDSMLYEMQAQFCQQAKDALVTRLELAPDAASTLDITALEMAYAALRTDIHNAVTEGSPMPTTEELVAAHDDILKSFVDSQAA